MGECEGSPSGSGALVLRQGRDMLNEPSGIGNPRDDVRFLEEDEIYVVAFLPPLKEVVINSSHLTGTFPVFTKCLLKRLRTHMLRRGKATLDKKGGYRVKTCIVKAVYTEIPPPCIGKHLGFFQGLTCSVKPVQNNFPARLRHSLFPSCSTLW